MADALLIQQWLESKMVLADAKAFELALRNEICDSMLDYDSTKEQEHIGLLEGTIIASAKTIVSCDHGLVNELNSQGVITDDEMEQCFITKVSTKAGLMKMDPDWPGWDAITTKPGQSTLSFKPDPIKQ